MTTPTGGDDLTIRAGLSFDEASAQEAARQSQRAGEQAARAFAEGAASSRVELPGIDTSAIYADIDRLVERVAVASRNMNLRLSEGIAGGAGLGGAALQSEMQRYQSTMEASTGGSMQATWVRGFAEAIRNDTRLLSQGYDELQAVTAKGRAIGWALQPEARQFLAAGLRGDRYSNGGTESFAGGLQHGQVVPAPPQASRPVAGQLGDLERVRAAGMDAISRIVLDDATYAFQDGQFFKVNGAGVQRKAGPISDPAMQARLVEAQRVQFAAAQEQISRATLDQLATADPGVSRFGMLPSQGYGPHGIPGSEIIPSVQQTIASNDPAVIRQAVEAWQMLGVTVREAPGAIGALNEALTLLDVKLQAARQAALEATHGPLVDQTQRAMLTPAPIGTDEEAAQNAYLAQLRLRRQAADQAANDTAAQNLIYQARQRTLPAQFGGLASQTLATMTGGAGGQPPFPPRAGGLGTSDEYDENAYLNALRQRALLTGEATKALISDTDAVLANARALSAEAGVTDEMVAAQRRLVALRPEMTTTPGQLGAGTELDAVARRQLLAAGSTVGGDIGARTGQGIALFNPQSGAYKEQISDTEALNREQAQAVETSRAAAAANDEAAVSYEKLSAAELKAFIALQDYNKAVAEQHAMTANGSPYERSQATLQRMAAEQNLISANQATQAPKGFIGQFTQGLFMARGSGEQGDNNAFLRLRSESGEFLGAIARYQAAYAVIFTLTRGFGAMLQAEEQSQDAMVEFSRATQMSGQSAEKFASDLGRVTSAAGFGVGQAMQTATAGIFAFGDQVQSAGGGTDVRRQVGTASAQSAAMAAVLTGSKDIAATQSQLIASTRGFNLGFQDQTRVLDAAANAAHNYGGNLAGILEGLPQIAQVAHQAGLSVEATSNIISLAMARGGQTGTTAASAVDRSLLAIDQPAARQTLGALGVDVSGQSGQVLESLASKWKGLSAAQQDQAEKALGGVRAMKSLLPVLQEGSGLVAATKESYQNAGYASELYFKRLDTLSGLIRQIGGDFKDLANDIANTGALDLFGVALKTLHPFLQGLDDIAKLIDLIPSSMRAWIVNLAAVAALLTVIGKQQAAVNVETAAAGAGGLVRTGEEGAVLTLAGRRAASAIPSTGSLQEASLAEKEMGRFRTGLSAAGGALMGPLGLTVAAVGVTAAIGGTIDALHKMSDAVNQSAKAQEQLVGAKTADQFHAAASALSAAAANERHSSSGVFGSAINFLQGNPTGQESHYDLTQAKYANTVADALDAQAKHTVLATGSITTSLQQMTDAGYPAVAQVTAVAAALNRLAHAGGGPNAVPVVAGTVSTGLAATAGAAAINPDTVKQYLLSVLQGEGDTSSQAAHDFKSISKTDLSRTLGSDLKDIGGAKGVSDAITQAQQQLGIKAGDVITEQQQGKIADLASGILAKKIQLFDKSTDQVFRDAIKGAITGSYGSQSKVKNPMTLSDTDLTSQWNALLPSLQAAPGQANPLQPDSQIAILRQVIGVERTHLAAAKARGDQALIDSITIQLNNDTDQFVKDQITRAERLRAAAVAAAGNNPAAILAANVKAVEGEIKSAAKVGDIAEVIAIIATADKATMRAVDAAINLELNVAQQSYAHAMAVYREAEANWQQLPANLRAANPELAPQQPVIPPALRTARQAKNAIAAANAAGATTSADTSAADTANALAEAKIAATERPGDPISAAHVAVELAQYAKKNAKTRTDFWNAVKQLNDAEYQLQQALNTAAHEARLSHIDQTDPVATAREDVRTARDQLNRDRKNKTGDTTADEIALQAARARAQAAAFDQRLSDVTTAHDLGRISDAAYLKYLESQSARLHAIHNKTRQQIDEMNQVDEAIKAAGDQMQGQWNIGAIKIPTPYEVRRYIAAQSAGTSYEGRGTAVGAVAAAAGAVTNNNNMQVTVNGTQLTLAQITALFNNLIAQNFGTATLSRTGTVTQRVR